MSNHQAVKCSIHSSHQAREIIFFSFACIFEFELILSSACLVDVFLDGGFFRMYVLCGSIARVHPF